MRYIVYPVIKSFKDADTLELFTKGKNRRWRNIEAVAKRKLDMVHAATTLSDLRVPPRNMLEVLKGNRKGQHSIRINDQYRICLTWKEDGPHDVEVTDYH